MSTINISYLKINLEQQIIDYNENLANLFNLDQISQPAPLSNIINSLSQIHSLKNIKIGELHSIIAFCNNRINSIPNHDSMLILYATITRHSDYYLIRIVNWLNWLHHISNSLEHGYSLMSKFNQNNSKDKFSKISDACCFKAFYPLITYIPQKFSSGVNQYSLFEIMRIFVKRREDGNYTKDYSRNVYSRIRTNLKQEFNLDNFDAIDLIKDDELLKIRYENNICIPNTLLFEDIILLIDHDQLLVSVIDSICPAG